MDGLAVTVREVSYQDLNMDAILTTLLILVPHLVMMVNIPLMVSLYQSLSDAIPRMDSYESAIVPSQRELSRPM